ncbi:unnamed protein product [Cuscuta campestris]|uniref:Reverse transcriptase domain-containing protein n=1 Tax=Cuscuta campestris TaxID=132261 RepID=A0A484MXL6_9ASTE|nr:unnamed protein product [Cuscuta campestris]
MAGLGFPSRFISLVMECVCSASSSIMVNGDSHGFLPSKRGLRQGDPMAPTLFLFCIEYFSRLLNKKAKEGSFNYHKDCAGLGITHLAFADDLMLFSRGDLHSVQVLMDALDHFSRVSGLTLNPTKSNIFLAGKYRDSSHALLALASFPRGQLPVRYLGLPLASQRISEKDFSPLFKTVEGYLSKWSTLKLSYAGRLELVRAVIQGVQSFWLQVFPVQKYVLDRITSLCRNFLWGSKLAKWQPKKRNSVLLKRLAHVRELLVQKLANCNSNMDMAMQPYCSAGFLIPRKIYDLFRAKANPKPWMAFIWQSFIPPKCSFTIWLALRRRLPTKTNLEFLGVPMECTFCAQELEDVDHLFPARFLKTFGGLSKTGYGWKGS